MRANFVMIATWEMAYKGMEEQYQKMLNETTTIDQAIINAVHDVEDNPNYKSVGYGGLPNIDGNVQLDASFMQGDTMRAGALAAIEGFANPVDIAYKLKDNQFNSFLVGEGATKYAEKNGFKKKLMLTEDSLSAYNERLKRVQEENLSPYSGHDTVCILGKDTNGSISVGTSTSGLFMKENGRVGDSPLSGSGYYANSDFGACAATGLGEDIMKTCISFDVVSKIKSGLTAQQAADLAMKEATENLKSKYGKCGDISIVCCDADGNYGAASNISEFTYVVMSSKLEPTVYRIDEDNNHILVN